MQKIAEKNVLTFTYNASGIKACLNADCKGDCTSCKVFRVGQTTKSTGTGLGMISVFRTLKKYKGDIRINTSENGTEIEVSIPVNKESL